MGLVYKQLYRQVIKDKMFLSLLLLLTMLTALSFFFVRFSIDGNMAVLNTLDVLTENQQLYQNALKSNSVLAYSFLEFLTGLSALVYIMFFYRFFRANKKQLGCIKALGFKENSLQSFFVIITSILSFSGALLGFIGGYFLSDILINANSKTYTVTGLTKDIGGYSIMVGFIAPTFVYCAAAVISYGFVRNKEAGFLMTGNTHQSSFSVTLKAADKISQILPANKRLSLRVALRKPLSVSLLFIAVLSFGVCIILGQSLNISSAKVFDAQTKGHNYEYNTIYSEVQTAEVPGNTMVYIDSPASFSIGSYSLERTITGLYYVNEQYKLKNCNNELLIAPERGTVFINPEFSEIYGVRIGDSLAVDITGIRYIFIVADIAANAKANNIYMNGEQLAEILGVPTGAYNGAFSLNKLWGDNITTKMQRIDSLDRNAVSNKVSGVINQAIGVLVGAILIFLAIYINFQDTTHDILILSMLGYRNKCIRKMFINIYLPVLWLVFAITLAPSICIAKMIQKSLSVSTNDYMPFGINSVVILAAFIFISLIYLVVHIIFSLGIKNLLAKSKISDIIYAE